MTHGAAKPDLPAKQPLTAPEPASRVRLPLKGTEMKIAALTLCALALIACGGGPVPEANQKTTIAAPDGGVGLVKHLDCEGPVYLNYGLETATVHYGYHEWTDGTINVTCSADMPDGSQPYTSDLPWPENSGQCSILAFTDISGNKNYIYVDYVTAAEASGDFLLEGPHAYWSGEDATDNTPYARPDDATYGTYLFPNTPEMQPVLSCTPRDM